MASIRKRGPYQYQAEIRRKGYPAQRKTFETRREAEGWAAVIESEQVRGVFSDRREVERTTLDEALARYASEITPTKRAPERELQRIEKWRAHPLARRSLASLRSVDFAAYRNDRLKKIGPTAVRLELAVISHMYTIAIKEWSLPLENPIRSIRRPAPSEPRSRRLTQDEEIRLISACRQYKYGAYLRVAIGCGIEAGLRVGEVVTLTWTQVNLASRVIKLTLTQNGNSRVVPLSPELVDLLKGLPRSLGRVFPVFDHARTLDSAFARARDRAGILNLRFQDLRHEAASRFAPAMEIAVLAKVMGWRTIQMAMRYYNPTDDELIHAIDKARSLWHCS